MTQGEMIQLVAVADAMHQWLMVLLQSSLRAEVIKAKPIDFNIKGLAGIPELVDKALDDII